MKGPRKSVRISFKSKRSHAPFWNLRLPFLGNRNRASNSTSTPIRNYVTQKAMLRPSGGGAVSGLMTEHGDWHFLGVSDFRS